MRFYQNHYKFIERNEVRFIKQSTVHNFARIDLLSALTEKNKYNNLSKPKHKLSPLTQEELQTQAEMLNLVGLFVRSSDKNMRVLESSRLTQATVLDTMLTAKQHKNRYHLELQVIPNVQLS